MTENTLIYDLMSAPQITRFLLADAIFSSKTRVAEARSREERQLWKLKIKQYQQFYYLFEFSI